MAIVTKRGDQPGKCLAELVGTRGQQALGVHSHHIHERFIVDDLLQDRRDCSHPLQASAYQRSLHAIHFVVEGKLLVTTIEFQSPSELKRRAQILKHRGQVLHRNNERVVVSRASVFLCVPIGEDFNSCRSYILFLGIDLPGEESGLLCEVKNLNARGLGNYEIEVESIVRFGLAGKLAIRLIACFAIGSNGEEIMRGFRVGETQIKGNGWNLSLRRSCRSDRKR